MNKDHTCSKSNLRPRVEKSEAAKKFSSVIQRDKNGLARCVALPGSNGKQYMVILRRGRCFSTELLLKVNGQNVKKTYMTQITYHQLAAVEIAAEEQGYKVTWFASRADAKRFSNFGGRVFRIRNFDNPQKIMWGVMRKE